MALPVEYEVLIPLFLGVIFTLLYEVNPEENLWAGAIATTVWIVTGLLYLVVSSYPIFAWLFSGIGTIYTIRIVIAAFDPLKRKQSKRLEGDTD